MSRNTSIPNRFVELERHIKVRNRMLDEGLFSLDAGTGQSIVITSGSDNEERESLAEHAQMLVEDKTRAFFGATILSQPNILDVKDKIADPEVASIAFIGDGNFSGFNLNIPDTELAMILSWYKLASMATHLKRGIVEQRTCTRINNPHKDVRVALPAFIVADQTAILSTVGEAFATHHGHEVFTPRLRNVYLNPTNTADELRQPIGFSLEPA